MPAGAAAAAAPKPVASGGFFSRLKDNVSGMFSSQPKAAAKPESKKPEETPKAEAAPAFRATSESVASLPRPPSAWWTEFGNDELNRLQELALANNRDHRVAIARVAQANAQARLANANKGVTVEAFGGVQMSAPEAGRGAVDPGEAWSARPLYQAGVRAAYEVDLWGRQGYAADSALAQAAASQHARETVALTLTADVALSYFEYVSYVERAKILDEGVASRQRSLAGVKRRAELGDATSLEVDRQQFDLSRTEEAATLHAQRRERAFNRLAFLLGMSPTELRLSGAAPSSVRVPEINSGLPSELLCRRPDIRRLEAVLEASRLDIRSIRASLLPSFSLTAEAGIGARALSRLASGDALFFLLSSALNQTLIDSGRKDAQLEIARARHMESLEQYAGALLAALRDVDDALAARHLSRLQHETYLRAADSATQQHELRRRALDKGNSDLLAVYLAEQRMLEARDSVESTRFERMRASVDLYRALGGGSRVDGRDPCLR